MTLRSLNLPLAKEGVSGYGVVSFVAALIVVAVVAKLSQSSTPLDAIPTVGSNGWFGSWLAGFKFLRNGIDILQEGYEKHKGAPFKIASFHNWIVVLSSHQHIEELRTAPDNAMSFVEAVGVVLQVKYTMSPGVHHNPYHIQIIRTQLTRSISGSYPDIRNEISAAFDDVLDLKGNEWKSVPALKSVQQVVCRASNRTFVGLPLCRDPDWIDLNIQFTNFVVKGALFIRLFPEFLKPLATRVFTRIAYCNERARKLIGPVIEERQKYLNEYGKQWADKPNDFLSWLMDEAEGSESTVESLTTRMLVVNFTAIHTSSTSFTHALFYLAAKPQYIQPLREEVESIVREEGWSKTALSKMRKVDSFLRECQRMEGFSGMSLLRTALKDFTLSDGTIIPKGTMIASPSRAMHYDETHYPNATTFEPFRFSDMRQQEGEGMKYQYVSTATEYLVFGHGQHACPGRFFAAFELKSMLAHIVLMYDVKLEDGATQPQSLHIGSGVLPDPNAKVVFRKRT